MSKEITLDTLENYVTKGIKLHQDHLIQAKEEESWRTCIELKAMLEELYTIRHLVNQIEKGDKE